MQYKPPIIPEDFSIPEEIIGITRKIFQN